MREILNEVMKDLEKQEAKGLRKYGTTLDSHFTESQMIQHAYEEALDTVMYLKKLINIRHGKHTTQNILQAEQTGTGSGSN